MMKRLLIFLSLLVLFGILAGGAVFLFSKSYQSTIKPVKNNSSSGVPAITSALTKGNNELPDPLAIENMRKKSYPGSDIVTEQTLEAGSNFKRFLVSYQSEGLKIYGLLTVPEGEKPAGGYPVIVFHHGYIPPARYSTVDSYRVWVNYFASAGYIVFKPDYRGNGNSEGDPVQPYISPDYVTDSMNAIESIKKFKDANPDKIGIAGHSMGGNIVLHELVMSKDVKVAVLLAGVVGNQRGLIDWWKKRFAARSIEGNDLDTWYEVEKMLEDQGTPENNPLYWNAIDPTHFLESVSATVQIQVGSADEVVPPEFSRSLRDSLQNAGKTVEYHEFPGVDHNFSSVTNTALQEAVRFFDMYIK